MNRIELQIVEREVSLGMLPVLPAFAGYVPDELIVCVFIQLIMNSNYILMFLIRFLLLGMELLILMVKIVFQNLLILYSRRLVLCSFKNNYILFHFIPFLHVSFIDRDFYGYTSHFYNGDLFMEMDVIILFHSHDQPKSMEPEYLRSCSKGMIESIKNGDKDGVWLMETWVFINFYVWTEDHILCYSHLLQLILINKCCFFLKWY